MISKRTIIAASFLFTFVSSASLVYQTDGFAMPKANTAAKQVETVTGTVLEAMNASGYTYMQVDTGKDKVWVAIPATEVKKGDTITYNQGMVMPDFHSKTLGRSFKQIIFSSGLAGQGAGNPHKSSTSPHGKKSEGDSFSDAVKAESGPAAATSKPPQVSGGSAGATAPLMESKVEKASGENGYTVEEIFTKSKELNGKKVRVKGKIVKYNPNIMGKNWIHLQDGTGDPMANTHDLVVTTEEKLSSQDIITIEGTMTANKDFGAGYKYAVIVEGAKIIK